MKNLIKFLIFSAFLGVISEPAIAQYNCDEPPQGIKSVAGGTDYIDSQNSVVDPKLQAQFNAVAKPYSDYMDAVSRAADVYLDKNDKSAGRCAITWLSKWSDDDALTGQPVNVRGLGGIYQNNNMLQALSFAFLKVLPEATSDEKIKISNWMKRGLVKVALKFLKNYPDGNNHAYWAALGIMVVGVISNDQSMVNISSNIYNEALNSIQTDGSLPREMARGQMALAYNGWACAPLFIMSELARKTGKDWYRRDNYKLSMLAERFVTGLIDPSWFQEKTGKNQIVPGGRNLGWLELYRRVAKNPEELDKILIKKEYFKSSMGGDLAVMTKVGFFNPNLN